ELTKRRRVFQTYRRRGVALNCRSVRLSRRSSRPCRRKQPMVAINSVAELTIDGEVALVAIDSPPVNALSQAVRDGLKRGVEAAEANGAVKAFVIICDGRTFIAGADISEFGKPPAPPSLHEALD